MAERAYKMIAIDLDGTLLSPLGHVTARTKSAGRYRAPGRFSFSWADKGAAKFAS